MGKIIKYCAVCEESFADKFSFCPNCAADLQTFEMNPVLSKKEFEDSIKQFEGKVISEKEFYNVTFVEGKGSTKRKSFLLGATLLVMGGAVFSLIGSIYNADAYVGALDDSLVYVSSISDDDPYKIEEPDLPKGKELGSNGGNGGNKDPNPVSKGVLANQSENPLMRPSVTMTKVTDPAIKVRMETEGVVKRQPTSQPYGDENSKYEVLSDGDGQNGGQGNGPDRGQGIGKGPGAGPREGPGFGTGPIGPGIAQNKPKIEIDDPLPPPTPKGVTVALKITEKPRAIYTQEGRKNQTSGTVTLRVTFMANGSIGNIAVVSGLPDGLTEQAIAAARNIQFEPAKRNGVAQTVTKQVQYTFTLY